MFLGHYAVAFAAKRAVPVVSLGTLILAAQFSDGLWPLFLLAGLEHVEIAPGNTPFTPLAFVDYPLSHSLLLCAVWAVALGGAYYLVRRYRAGALVVAALVLSHWVLDAASHRPDLPLYPGGGTLVGFGLWKSVPGTLAVESAMFAVGLWLYLASTRARDRTGVVALWALVVVLVAAYLGAAFGPPPPNVTVLAYSGLIGWLTVAWGYWVDRHREPAGSLATTG
ncbi:MAG TPA: hypothetical protein VKC64_00770 [Burkholderiales bacterium]|nr:hypothetical protein [Burkholderiales bacterium]